MNYLNHLINCTIKIKGSQNLIQEERFFVASAHQSMFETFFLQTIIESPVFILKKELFKIPVFGLFLKKMGSIAIIRNTTTKDNLDFLENISNTLTQNKRTLIIFPQGTRTPVGVFKEAFWTRIELKTSRLSVPRSVFSTFEVQKRDPSKKSGC